MTQPTPPPPTHTPEVRVNTNKPSRKDDPDSKAKLPHERDQSVNMTDGQASPQVEQAYKDVKRGLRDTDARASDGRPAPAPTRKNTQ